MTKQNIILENGFTQNLNPFQTKKYLQHCFDNKLHQIELKIKSQPIKTKLVGSYLTGKLLNFTDHHIVLELHSINNKSADRRVMLFEKNNKMRNITSNNLENFINLTTKVITKKMPYLDACLNLIDKDYYNNYNKRSEENYNIKEFINIFDIEMFKCSR